MHGEVFTQLSLVIVIASAVALVMRFLRQPLIIGYIITGILVGPAGLDIIHDRGAFDTFSEIGIALLLFIIGLELSVPVLRRLGKPVIITAGTLLLTIGTVGFVLATLFRFDHTEALLTGLALFFSSTIIIAKVLSDKKELGRLNGQIAVGVILVDDIIATFALLFVAAQSGGTLTPADLAFLILKGLVFVGVLIFCGAKLLPPATRYIARSQDLLFLFALAWGFGVASLVNAIGFSVEVGALFAGVALAHLPYVHQIGAKLKPLRDFFVILFFIALGERLQMDNLAAGLVPALVLSVVVLLMKPLVVAVTLGWLGYTKRTSFKAGINLSQISEFSIILTVLAAESGLIGAQMGATITLVAIITIAISTYLMQYDDWIYVRYEHLLKRLERRNIVEKPPRIKEYDLVLFGYKYGGPHVAKAFAKLGKPYVVVDYDPEIIRELRHEKVPHVYGDVMDPELLHEIAIDKAKLVINIIGDHAVNLSMVRYMARHNPDAITVCYAQRTYEAFELYALGATHVILPFWTSSDLLADFVARRGLDKHAYEVELASHASSNGNHGRP